jgi:hypothetical protein
LKFNPFTDFLYPLAGVLLISGGALWMYRPLGPMTLGAFLIIAAFLGKKRKA